MSPKKEKIVGLVAAVFSVGGAIVLAFAIAFHTFWWCPQGGCSLVDLSAKLHLLGNLVGLLALVIAFVLALLLVFVLLSRPFVTRETIEQVVFGMPVPGLGWYDKLQRKWVALLYR